MVNEFTLNQQKDSTSVIISPVSDGCNIELDKYPNSGNNYEKIDDPYNVPDGDDTYVHTDSTSSKYDIYTLPNQSLSGVINYVNVNIRGKTNPVSPADGFVYKILITDDDCISIYKSDNQKITNYYKTFQNRWVLNPRTTSAWTWNDIDNLQVGVEHKSINTQTDVQTITLNPMGDGDVLGLSGDWSDVNSFNTSTYVYNNSYANDQYELFEIEDSGADASFSDIKSVTIFMYGEGYGSRTIHRPAKIQLKTHGVTYDGTTVSLERYNPKWFSDTWTTNPNTGNAWTWSEINNMQYGVWIAQKSYYNVWWSAGRVFQMYCVVEYKYNGEPALRTTQEYVVINYTPNPDSTTLPIPDDISSNHTNNIKTLNFWNGEREVYSLNRSNKTLVLRGQDWQDDACTRIQTIRDMGEEGSDVTLSGLNMYIFNDTYKIRSFGWELVHKTPIHYKWILELEYTD